MVVGEFSADLGRGDEGEFVLLVARDCDCGGCRYSHSVRKPWLGFGMRREKMLKHQIYPKHTQFEF